MSIIKYTWSRAIKKMTGSACKNVIKRQPCKIGAGSTVINVMIRERSYIGYDCVVLNCDIGKYCSIADQTIIGVGDEHPINWVSSSSAFFKRSDGISKGLQIKDYVHESKRTIIGNDVWIGRRAVIKAGVTVGDGAVIGTSCVVTKNVPPYAIVVGIPGKIIRYRFEKDIIERLEEAKWWELPVKDINKVIGYIDKPELFLSEIENKDGKKG